MRPALAWGLAFLVLLADQLSKAWIVAAVGLKERLTIPVLPVFSLTWVENRGLSMGLFTADSAPGRWLLVALTLGIAAFVARWLRRERRAPEQVALALVLGGAIGNIIDRVRLGYVIDFIHLHLGRWSFYVFNVADAAITAGVALLLVRALAPERREAQG
ncbi:signal peptidase II [Thermaurantiacus sp.]